MGTAERRRTTLQAELVQLDGSRRPPMVQLTTAMLERHLQGMIEKLRSGVNGKVREAIQQSIARILVGVDGSLMVEAKPEGLLGLEGTHPHLRDEREESPMIGQAISSSSGRQWKVTSALNR